MNAEKNTVLGGDQKADQGRLSKVQGCLIGGAVGDALGYAVEFNSYKSIVERYGPQGIQNYELDYETDLALISDDTQMTLFTANGLLAHAAQAGKAKRGMEAYIFRAYLDWYHCQMRGDLPKGNISWLSELPEMHSRRAPGNTCMAALRNGGMGTLDEPLNNSKGCGGVMRVAPIGLWTMDVCKKMVLGAEAAVCTHGHPLGYLPAAALAHIVHRAVFGGCRYGGGLRGIVQECREMLPEVFPEEGFCRKLNEIIAEAERLSQNDDADVANIKKIGEGWTGEEALGIAVYCCLKYPDDFSKAMIAAVNHDGDSDSTGAVAGNILGAWLGMEGIEKKWLANLELKSVILEIAEDICGDRRNEAWIRKYAR